MAGRLGSQGEPAVEHLHTRLLYLINSEIDACSSLCEPHTLECAKDQQSLLLTSFANMMNEGRCLWGLCEETIMGITN